MTDDSGNETYSLLSSKSENEEFERSVATSSQNAKVENSDEDGEHWKKALLARDLDMLHTCTLMIVSHIPSVQRLELSQNIMDSLKDIKGIILNDTKQEGCSGTLGWKNALLARNMDLIDTSLHIIMMDIPSVLREQLGRTIVAALQDVERVSQNDEIPAEHLIHCTETIVDTNDRQDIIDRQFIDDDDREESGKTPNASPSEVSKPINQKKQFKQYSVYRGPLPAPEAPRDLESMKQIVKEGVCPICKRILPGYGSRCGACKIFALRMTVRLGVGYDLQCDHEDCSGGVSCRKCRYDLFNLMTEEGYWI